MKDCEPKIVTARDLLKDFLALRHRAPDISEWDEAHFAGNRPRLFRLRRLVACFTAFEIEWNIARFIRGGFIKPHNSGYSAILETAAAELAVRIDQPLGPHPHQLPRCFEILLRYRQSVEATLSCFADTWMASGLNYYALKKAAKLNQIIKDNVSSVDDVLVALISPEGKSLPMESMVREFNYPDVDLLAIDIECLFGGESPATGCV